MRMPALLILLLSSFCAHAAFRMPPAPVLHSVFDKAPAADAPPDSPGRRAWWIPPPPPPRRVRPIHYLSENQRADRQTKGIVLLCLGGAAIATGVGLLLYADAETRRQVANNGHSYTFPYYFGGYVLCLSSLAFIIPGTLITAKYSRRHYQRYRDAREMERGVQ